jgi:hypothetical protein
MVSVFHQMVVDMFHQRAELAPELLSICAEIALAHAHATLTSIDLSQVTTTEYRADAVLELRDEGNDVVSAVITEVQLRIDEDKLFSWPLYITALRAKLRRPVTLLVFTNKRSVARWARASIPIGHPDFQLRPVVIAFDQLPRIIDPAYATKLPELAVLSTLAHPELEVAETAIRAISTLPDDQHQLYLDIILMSLPRKVRRLLEGRMKGYVYRSEFARKYYYQGHDKGVEEGIEKGIEKGLRAAVAAIALARRTEITAAQQVAVDGLDEGALTALIRALGRARTAAAARTALEAATQGVPRT